MQHIRPQLNFPANSFIILFFLHSKNMHIHTKKSLFIFFEYLPKLHTKKSQLEKTMKTISCFLQTQVVSTLLYGTP